MENKIVRKHYTMTMDRNRVIHVHFDTQYHLTSSFMRLQEFYESPYKEIRECFFTVEDFMDRYADSRDGKFTYFEDWIGFNVPGYIVMAFIREFGIIGLGKNLMKKEKCLLEDIANLSGCHPSSYVEGVDERFYVIGTYGNRTIRDYEHEYAHAMFYLFPKYKREMMKLNREVSASARKKMEKEMISLGYHRGVFSDEIQAYISTENPRSIESRFNIRNFSRTLSAKYRRVFEKFHGAD